MHRSADDLKDLDRALGAEWLLTDGAGGYASMTALFSGTRRYHGLWVPALRPPLDRRVILAHLGERLTNRRGEHYLFTCEYADGFYPDGSQWAERFDLDPLPRLTSRVRGAEVRREVLLLRDGQGVCITYRVEAETDWSLELAPFLALRSMHHLASSHDRFGIERTEKAPGFRCLTEGLPGVFLWTDARADADVRALWYYGLVRRVERERGFDFSEDLLAPGWWTVRGEAGEAEFHIFASFDPPREIDVAAAREAELSRRAERARAAGSPSDERIARLVEAADAFLVRRRVTPTVGTSEGGPRDLTTVIAGYPWFGDWGRDAMIALPGLAIETGRMDEAGRVLEAFASACDEGMIPNRFAEESGEAEYNTVDASLWFLQAVAAYVRAGAEAERVRRTLWPAVLAICARYRCGTRFGIRADADGLIVAGSEDTQLTWMDATAGGAPVTPRHGKAVEIEALWLSGTNLMWDLAEELKAEKPSGASTIERARVRSSFESLFWNDEAGCLYDCVGPGGMPDASVRPNQVLAVGLPHAPLAGERAEAVVETVREKLLTPRGLRTLAPDEAAYCGRYEGGPDERDAAYHQGTVWPWLLGPYGDAVFATAPTDCARGECQGLLEGLLDSMEKAGLGQISEIFDGDPPHRPRGCIAQAWSVAAAVHLWRRLEETRRPP
jgi:predicted glycogen debranching enzyme